NEMVDEFIDGGFNYFDTAHGYHEGFSEVAIRKCVVDRYDRSRFVLTDKLTEDYFKREEDIEPFFEKQLSICGVEYFDFYLMHAQNATVYEHFKRCRAYEKALLFKAQGRIKHFGISFHDRAEVLENILTEYPQIEVVQIQYNYLDDDDPAVQGKKCLEVCEKFNKPVIVMEPIKGGNLVRLPEDVSALFSGYDVTPAALALRFAATPKSVMMVLSGMKTIKDVAENVKLMSDFEPISEREKQLIEAVKKLLRSKNMIACTACRYCVEGCPKRISIPDLFACFNAKKHFHDWNAAFYYNDVYTVKNGKASDCIACGKCERSCPQKLQIRALLKQVAKEFEN
ncbi:MAG: aldo/keto reductase, partial [Clostridia bacterium]|nr:aldo/keto reductase [Clostridia bacterium]